MNKADQSVGFPTLLEHPHGDPVCVAIWPKAGDHLTIEVLAFEGVSQKCRSGAGWRGPPIDQSGGWRLDRSSGRTFFDAARAHYLVDIARVEADEVGEREVRDASLVHGPSDESLGDGKPSSEGGDVEQRLGAALVRSSSHI